MDDEVNGPVIVPQNILDSEYEILDSEYQGHSDISPESCIVLTYHLHILQNEMTHRVLPRYSWCGNAFHVYENNLPTH